MSGAMEVYTKRQKTQGVPKRFRATYYYNGSWRHIGVGSGDAEEMYHRIVAAIEAGGEAVEDAIEGIIGNRGWTRLACDECGLDRDAVVVFEPDDEVVFYLCASCLQKAVGMIEGQQAA